MSYIQKKHRILYTSDVKNLDHLSDLSGTFDLMICECTHVELETAAVFSIKHNIPKLLLTHIPLHMEVADKLVQLKKKDLYIEFAQVGKWIEF